MKRNSILATSLVILFAGIGLYLNHDTSNTNQKEQAHFNYPSEWMDYQRAYPNEYIKPEAYLEAMEEAAILHKQSASRDIYWEFSGPTNIGGRITDLAFHPSDMNTIYVGGASGGILKSTNAGQQWTNIFTEAAVISIGDLAVDPNNKNVIYAGTGEANASSFSFLGNGIYKSTDAGDSWSHIGLELSAYIGRIVVDHSNSQNVYVAACGNLFSHGGERGIYKSSNGGGSWEQILFINDSTAGIDLVQHPDNPDILYAAMWQRTRGRTYRNSFGDGSGIWKTTDGGNNWTELTNGFPTGDDVGRIGIDISLTNPDVLYAFIDMPYQEVRLYRTDDGGDSWNRGNDNILDEMNSSFGWYFGQVRVDPNDENKIYVMGVDMFTSDDGGQSWTQLAGYFNSDVIHVDHHAMYIDPISQRVYNANDGGLYYSDDQGVHWTEINNIPLTQFYAIDIDHQYPERIYGGTQDNNTIRTTTGSIDDWEAILGGDGMYCLVDYDDNSNVYAESQWGGLSKSTLGGSPGSFNYIAWSMSDDRTNWSAPLAMDPENPNRLYFGTYRVWRSMNGGNSWSSVSSDLTQGGSNYFHSLTTIDVSPINPNIVIVGSADGKVHISSFGGNGWTDISEGLPDRWITRVEADPFEENTIYVTVSGFRWDDSTPHVYKSTDLGENWVSISSNLPDLPVNVIVADPEEAGWLYIGTDAGAFYSDNGGYAWKSLMGELPNVAVTDMKIHQPSRSLVMGTYGISSYRLNLDFLVGTPEQISQSDSQIKASLYPNPVSGNASVHIDIEWPGFGSAEVGIYNLQGLELKRLYEGKVNSKTTSLIWNINQRSGIKPKSGQYVCRITQGGVSTSLPFVVIP